MYNTASEVSAVILDRTVTSRTSREWGRMPTDSCYKKYDHNCQLTVNSLIQSECLHCRLTLLTGRQEQHPACKNWVMWCWYGYLTRVSTNYLHIVQLMPKPPIIKILNGSSLSSLSVSRLSLNKMLNGCLLSVPNVFVTNSVKLWNVKVLALVNSRHHCQLRSFKYAWQFRWITRIAFNWWLRLWKCLNIPNII